MDKVNIEDIPNYLISLITPLVTNPGELKCETKIDQLGTLFILNAAKEDKGKIIGRAGNMINAVRLILKAIGLARGVRLSLKIQD